MSSCVRPGCTGSYGPEGFCDDCGLKAPAGTAAAGAPAGPATTGTGTTGTRGAGWSGSGATVSSTRGRSSRRGQLGAGLVDVPRVPLRDPASVVMADPKVAESRRFCGSCDQPVGRGRDGKPGLDEGFCPHCRTRFSFLPRLKAGDLVNDRYELIGCLAYGGLGWIYLARDRNIGDEVAERWVVLKGLINTSDPDAMAAAVTERRFLVEVDHPNIVQIYDFVQHPDLHTGTPISYIVMEYVGGQSLRDLLLSRRGPTGRPEPMPLPQVLAYGLEILPALGYLHERGIVFCDFKPDNVIHAEEQLKLIDLGAVRRIDDQVSAVYGTPGYQAPDVVTVGPSVASDLYTVGRTLAVLSFDFVGFSTRYADRLPDPADVPLLASEESYYRLLRRATHPDPSRRFGSADEMREQLHGVLREVLSASDGIPRPAISTLFTAERRAFGVDGSWDSSGAGATLSAADIIASLPLPTVDSEDPAASYLATIGSSDPEALEVALELAPVRSAEVVLRLIRGYLEQGNLVGANRELEAFAADHRLDWRVDWYRGPAVLAAEQTSPPPAGGSAGSHSDQALAAFDAVYSVLPGEPAAQLGMAVAAEWAGQGETAATYYRRVWRTDRGFVSAAFGLARFMLATGDRAGAVAVLDEVPENSRYHTAAQIAAIRARLAAMPADLLTETDVFDASGRLERLRLDLERQARLSIEVLHKALRLAGPAGRPATGRVLGHALNERDLRLGLERAYRTMAKVSHDRATRAVLVDAANAVRPRTLL